MGAWVQDTWVEHRGRSLAIDHRRCEQHSFYRSQVPSPLPHQIRAPLANTCTWEEENPLPLDPSANRAHQGFSNPPRRRSSPVPPTQSVRRVSTLSQAAPPPPSPSVRSVRPDFTNPSHRGAAFVLVVQVINASPNRSVQQASLPRPSAPLA